MHIVKVMLIAITFKDQNYMMAQIQWKFILSLTSSPKWILLIRGVFPPNCDSGTQIQCLVVLSSSMNGFQVCCVHLQRGGVGTSIS